MSTTSTYIWKIIAIVQFIMYSSTACRGAQTVIFPSSLWPREHGLKRTPWCHGILSQEQDRLWEWPQAQSQGVASRIRSKTQVSCLVECNFQHTLYTLTSQFSERAKPRDFRSLLRALLATIHQWWLRALCMDSCWLFNKNQSV